MSIINSHITSQIKNPTIEKNNERDTQLVKHVNNQMKYVRSEVHITSVSLHVLAEIEISIIIYHVLLLVSKSHWFQN